MTDLGSGAAGRSWDKAGVSESHVEWPVLPESVSQLRPGSRKKSRTPRYWLRSLSRSLSCLADEPHCADEEQDGARGGQVGQPIHPARLTADVGDRLHQLNRCAK